jgi:hypothetical protein
MNRKLSDVQKTEIREQFGSGRSAADIGIDFGVSERTVRRVVGETAKDGGNPGLDVSESAETAVRDFLETLDLEDPAVRVLAASALQLARKLDTADARSAAQPASRLQDLVGELRDWSTEKSPLDEIRARRDARLREAQW